MKERSLFTGGESSHGVASSKPGSLTYRYNHSALIDNNESRRGGYGFYEPVLELEDGFDMHFDVIAGICDHTEKPNASQFLFFNR